MTYLLRYLKIRRDELIGTTVLIAILTAAMVFCFARHEATGVFIFAAMNIGVAIHQAMIMFISAKRMKAIDDSLNLLDNILGPGCNEYLDPGPLNTASPMMGRPGCESHSIKTNINNQDIPL